MRKNYPRERMKERVIARKTVYSPYGQMYEEVNNEKD